MIRTKIPARVAIRGLLIGLVMSAALASPSAAAWNDALITAAREGNTALVASLLERGADPNDYRDGYTPLMFAAGNGHAEMTRLLLARGARVEQRDHNGDRALLWAAERGHVDTVRLLLGAGAAVQSADDPYQITPLMKACRSGHLAVARVLIAAGADVRSRDHVNRTALHDAAGGRSTDLVELLLEAGADPNVAGYSILDTPLQRAAETDRAENVRLLVRRGADLDARDYRGRTALFMAAARNHALVVDILLTAGADPNAADQTGDSPFLAAARGDGAAARRLVERTSDIDRGFAVAVWHGHADLAHRLAARGADVNATDDLGRPALAGIVRHDGRAMLDWMIERGADLKRHGAAALASSATTGRLDLTEALLDAGIPVDARTEDGATALLHAAGAGRVAVVRLLLARGAARAPRDGQGRGVDDYMRASKDMLLDLIRRREASRAYRPTQELRRQLAELEARHAEVSALLA